MTLEEFLLARIAEDEAAGDPYLHPAHCMSQRFPYADSWDAGECDCGLAERSRAEREAKRRIVDAFEDERQRKDIYNRDFDLELLRTDRDFRSRLSSNARWAGLEIAARFLATIYAVHPDYDEAWRP